MKEFLRNLRNLRNADFNLYRKAVTVEREKKKLKRNEANLSFLIKCRDENVFPKFVKWKNTKYLDKHLKYKYHRKILLDEISIKHKEIRINRQILDQKEAILKENSTFIRRFVIEHAIDKAVTKSILPIQTKLSQKLELIISERNNKNHIEANPNVIITNLSSITLTNDEYETLQFGLNHGLAKQSRDVDTFVIAEDLCDQLYRNNILKDNHFSNERTKNILRCFAFNIINIDDKRIFKDAKRIKLIKKLR